jgi:hypothetical protein
MPCHARACEHESLWAGRTHQWKLATHRRADGPWRVGGAGERGALSAAWHGIASYLVLGAESAQRAAGAARAAPAGGRGRCRFRRRRFRRQRRWEERRSCIRRRFRGHVGARPRAARPLYLSMCLSSVCVRAKRWADRGVHGAARAGYPGPSSARAIVRAINERNSSRRIRRGHRYR